MNGYSPFLRHFHDLKEVDGNTVLWVGLVRFAQFLPFIDSLNAIERIMARKKYTQEQQVIDVLRQIGGYATLGDLYRLVDTKS